jgi:hypothetical protein
LIKNLRVKVRYESGTTNEDDELIFDTYDATKTPATDYERQKLSIERDTIIFFTSRKREWFNENLMTVAGVCTPKRYIKPKVHAIIPYDSNTHCVCFISSKICLASIAKNTNEDIKLLNGYFINEPNYKILAKRNKQYINASRALKIGVDQCEKLLILLNDVKMS